MGTVWGQKRSRVIEGLKLKATFALLIYFFSEENNATRNSPGKKTLETDGNEHLNASVEEKCIRQYGDEINPEN